MPDKFLIKILSDLEENLIELADYKHGNPKIDVDKLLEDCGVTSAAKDAGL
jgi:hypothetical protein